MKNILVILSAILISACETNDNISPVADDVLFLVLGKMSIYIQSPDGEHTLRDHHFVAEIMPKETGQILGGTLTSQDDPAFSLPFNPEGPQFLAHGKRVMVAEELHDAHPDGTYIFNYQTRNGEMTGQPLTLRKRETTDIMPLPATLSLSQNGSVVAPDMIDHEQDLTISWTQMRGNMKSEASELDDLIFVLAFDCFGNNIAHSGRPYNEKPYLSYKDTSYTIAAENLKQGVSYQLIVEQATADVMRHQGVPGIATYATLTFLDARAAGENTCPAN
ncbi:MAG: hypothetical protein HOJ34_01510 [Kordiimonadaceae bacterium]|jgi:hypothetical protein|nr:hypothetical protein [Kordiimonadaceae bacterium]MBT6036777.1 hypothetical protein [Kordiimonadaceae bacterium]MBT6328434.1 hypothetical protein [Kordiimonadaceae bacterium]MBT7582182.1 hypothetical protein [Kordiimonadaceae bacterium]